MSDILDEEYEEPSPKELTTLESLIKFEDGVERYTPISCFILIAVVGVIILSMCATCLS